MPKIILCGVPVTYEIVPKKNKNTYFRFQKDGTIKVTKSRYQTKQDIINYMKHNEVAFLKKINNTKVESYFKEGCYKYFGQDFKIEYVYDKKVSLDKENKLINLPHESIDHDGKILRTFERSIVLKSLDSIIDKHIHNGLIDISNIKYKTRHTKTRFGSCNPTRRTINFNANLIHYDIKYLEYVFLHEICHLKHANHSVDFYKLLEKLCPNYKQLRQELRNIYR